MTPESRLLAQADIREVILRYARGIDRCDWALVDSCFHKDAIDDHGGYSGSAAGFIERMRDRHGAGGIDMSMHFIGNISVRVDGERAAAESYCVAYQRARDAGLLVAIFGDTFRDSLGESTGESDWRLSLWCRYLDEFRYVADEGGWKIARRLVVYDDVKCEQSSVRLPEDLPLTLGVRAAADASYQLFPLGS